MRIHIEEGIVVMKTRKPPRRRVQSLGARSQVVLTRRERQIVELLLEGCANKEIAVRLGVSAQTVKNQLSVLYQKTAVGGRLPLVLFVLRNGLIRV